MRFLRHVTRWSTRIGLLALVVLFGAVLFAPKPSLYGDKTFSTAIYDRSGNLLRLTLAEDSRYRLRTSLEEVAESAIDATLLYEDRYFFRHPGVNPLSLVRAGWTTYIKKDRVLGASTITMQLARLRYGTGARNIRGKLVQIARAVQLERHYSKREILEAYLNLAPYGGNVEGIAAASLIYFDKPASELSLPEALALAVVPQNPKKRRPAIAESSREWLAARERLLEQWKQDYDISADSARQVALPLAVRGTAGLPFIAPHFVQGVEASATSGTVRSTLDLTQQRLLEDRLTAYVERRRTSGVSNASAMLVDARSMQLLASVGSADFFDDDIEGQVDGTQAKRSPGSTLKPFVYGMAIDEGLIHPASLMKDAPRRFAAYTPENFDRGFMGPVSAQDALIYSRNVPAIDLLSRVGHKRFHEFLESGEVRDLADPDFYGLAMVLGGIELTMEEVVRLYAMLANGGTLRSVSRTLDQPSKRLRRVLSPEASFLVLDMLRHNPRPGYIPAEVEAPSIAWKTGTSYAFRDAWAVGIVGHYVLAVWVGNFDGSGNAAFVGREAAAPLFFSIADALMLEDASLAAAAQPAPDLNLRKVDVCAGTGDLPGRHCPRTEKAWFIPGVSPIRVSDVHRAIRIDNESGLRSCSHDVSATHEAVYEFWPSDLAGVFRKAGIALRTPPAWSPDCELSLLSTTGNAPQIRSLSERLSYQLRDVEEPLPLTAATDADVRWLYWFVDDYYVGRAPAGEPMLWQSTTGQHRVLAVDDLGRSDSIDITVALAQE